MTNYNIRYKDDHLAHAGRKGMKWGFNDGQKNGKRVAVTPTSNAAMAGAAAAAGLGRYLYQRGRHEYYKGFLEKPKKEQYRLARDKVLDEDRYKKRLKKNALDGYGTTLAKYGLNKIGYGNFDDALERGARNVKKKAKSVVDKVIGKKKKSKTKPKTTTKKKKTNKKQDPFKGIRSKTM